MTRYRYLHQRRDPRQVDELNSILDVLWRQKVDEFRALIESKPLEPQINPRSRDPGADFIRQSAAATKAAADNDLAVQGKLRLLEQISMMRASADVVEDDTADSEDQAQLQRDLIAAVRGQMDPAKLAQMRSEIPALRDDGGDDE